MKLELQFTYFCDFVTAEPNCSHDMMIIKIKVKHANGDYDGAQEMFEKALITYPDQRYHQD